MNLTEVKNRVVITGLGVVAPNGIGLPAFTNAIKTGTSGITYHQNLKDKLARYLTIEINHIRC
jgi:3-oxoacyl-(acyl-carrier-protein) synthase